MTKSKSGPAGDKKWRLEPFRLEEWQVRRAWGGVAGTEGVGQVRVRSWSRAGRREGQGVICGRGSRVEGLGCGAGGRV